MPACVFIKDARWMGGGGGGKGGGVLESPKMKMKNKKETYLLRRLTIATPCVWRHETGVC